MIPRINKRGDLSSLIIGILVILFVIGVIVILFSNVFVEVLTIMKADPVLSGNNNSVETINIIESNTIPFLDYFFLFSFISIVIGLIISSIYIDVHPALMIIFIVLLGVVIVMAGIFANVFVEIGETTEIATTYNQFVMTKAIMNHLPLICFVVGLIVIFILYGKGRNSAGPM